MAKHPLITAEELRQILHYDPATGILRWAAPRRKIRKGDVAGHEHEGYIYIEINGRGYGAHRLAWLYMKGEWPSGQIDHRDGVKANNIFSNLRDATDLQNRLNRLTRADNACGYKGLTKTVRKGVIKYIVRVGLNGNRKYLGFFSDIELAKAAYREEAAKMHGEFVNFG